MKTIEVREDAITVLLQASQVAYDGIREVRLRAIKAGCTNAESNDLGGIMFSLSLVIDQLRGVIDRIR